MVGLPDCQHPGICTRRRRDLHSHRQAPRPEPDRHRQAGQADQADRHDHLHPAVIGVHGVPVDALRPAPVDREWPDLRGRQDNRVIGPEQPGRHGVPFRPDDGRRMDLRRAQTLPALDFPDRLGLGQGALDGVVVDSGQRVCIQHAAQRGPGLPKCHRRKGRGQGFNDCAQVLQHAKARLALRKYPRLAWIGPTPVAQPADAHAAKVRLQKIGIGLLPASEGHFGVLACDDLQQPRHILDRPAHRSFGRQRREKRVALRIAGHQAKGRTKPVDVAERGRIAQRPHHVGPVRHRHQPGRQCRRRSAG